MHCRCRRCINAESGLPVVNARHAAKLSVFDISDLDSQDCDEASDSIWRIGVGAFRRWEAQGPDVPELEAAQDVVETPAVTRNVNPAVQFPRRLFNGYSCSCNVPTASYSTTSHLAKERILAAPGSWKQPARETWRLLCLCRYMSRCPSQEMTAGILTPDRVRCLSVAPCSTSGACTPAMPCSIEATWKKP